MRMAVCSLRLRPWSRCPFDEIGSALKIKELQRDKRELLESLEMYYKVFFLGDIPDEELQKKADAVGD